MSHGIPMRQLVRKANIVRAAWPDVMDRHVNLYLGSGRAGACFDAWGLMNKGDGSATDASVSQTVLMHADHWATGAFGMDSFLPVARLRWTAPPQADAAYRQELDLWDAALTTSLSGGGTDLTVRAQFDPSCPDVLAVRIIHQGSIGPLELTPQTDPRSGHYDEQFHFRAQTTAIDRDLWLCRLQSDRTDTVLACRTLSTRGAMGLRSGAAGLALAAEGASGDHLLLIGVAAHRRREELVRELQAVESAEASAARAAEAWHKRWGDACVEIPPPEHQALWVRSHYYLLATYAPDVRSPIGPCGWTNNAWPRHFPQDLSCVAAAMLRLGHADVVKAWIEFYRSRLDEMLAFTRDVFGPGRRGAMWAWEFPIGSAERLLRDGAPNHCQYEIHNAAYVAHMARSAASYLRDPQWTRQVAWPVVLETARFYASCLSRRAGGGTRWGIHVTPSMGQDESGPPNAANYLCALTGAQYSLQAALALAAQLGISGAELEAWRAILSDRLAFERLLDPATGVYATCELGEPAADPRRQPLGNEKHPIQLTPLTYLPMGEAFDMAPVRRAHRMRYELCQESRRAYWGWTLSCMQLASARIGSPDDLLEDLGRWLPGRLVDDGFVQIYEGTHKHHRAYYTTSHAWYLLSLCEALVSDFWGQVRRGRARPPAWGDARYRGLRMGDGAVQEG